MIDLENSGIDEEEEVNESPKLVFKFAFQTETFERLSREGYNQSVTDDSGESEGGFLCSSSSSPVIFTAAARKYETPSGKNLTFVLENPKAATFRVEDCLKEKQEKTEDLEYSVSHGEDKVKTEDLGYSVSSGEKKVKTEDYSVSSIEKKKIRFLTEEDFLESDSDFVDSSQTFTSNDEDGFLSDSDFAEEKGQNRKNENSGSGSGSDSEEEEDTNGFESLWEHQDLIEQLKMEMKKVKAIGGLSTILEEEEEEDDCPKIMEDLKPWKIEEEKKFKHVDTIGEVHKFHRSYRERMRKLDILSFQKSYALEDGNKDKKNGRRRDYEGNDDGAIKSDQLVEIMEETIRLFWRFVRCDKLTSSIHDQKSRTKSQIEPDHEEDSEDLEMFAEVKSQLQNKEKRLKDVLKSERCIIRRFQKHKEEESAEDQVLHFFSQVDMKLVTRVLNMSKLTRDHLVWCHNKLTKINFVNRRLRLDPSFCLFPC
ncbi:unnamed protein product [Arabidopsis arenosa]|uniref:Uncharacterized protein n=1 Tax=Arabidopsis arenosa TaxID=38785 RepID=A0A8S2AWK2_ARAAE|nr:unnamed protein product [Arabidopsis arenosa]